MDVDVDVDMWVDVGWMWAGKKEVASPKGGLTVSGGAHASAVPDAPDFAELVLLKPPSGHNQIISLVEFPLRDENGWHPQRPLDGIAPSIRRIVL